MATSNVFDGFESVELPEGATELVYGVNVLQVQASVRTSETANTVATLVEKYRAQLGLPSDVVVFVDGVKLSSYDTIPADARRVEIVKPAGTKGADIPLANSDAVKIVIARENMLQFVSIREEEKGKVSKEMLDLIDLKGMSVLRIVRGFAIVGFRIPEIKAVRKNLLPIATMNRRLQGGIAETEPLTVNTVKFSQAETPLRVELNGQPFSGCRELVAGETLVIVLPGETVQEDFETWANQQRQYADGAVMAAFADREEKIEARTAELLAMNWAEVRILGARLGIKVVGLGRTGDAVRADILMAEFPEIDETAVYCAYLAENAPELLDQSEVETVISDDEEDSE